MLKNTKRMKLVHLYIFGIGNVGKTLIEQVLESHTFFKEKHELDLRIVGLANSTHTILKESGVDEDWQNEFKSKGIDRKPDAFYESFATIPDFKIAVDATASKDLSLYYVELLSKGFHIVTANKIANTLNYTYYKEIREIAAFKDLRFEYETNVGAALPIVESIKQLYKSGEEIVKISGVFSGSLGYIFSRFSQEEKQFSQLLQDALVDGYTEPDPRDDLSGMDVARKLLILAREAGYVIELDDIEVDNLVPVELRNIGKQEFLDRINELDTPFQNLKKNLGENSVLRHLGILDLKKESLTVKLEVVDKQSPAGLLRGSDGFFEVYTKSYGKQPLVIQGAGAGKQVTARGLLSDIIKVAMTAGQPVLR